MPDPRSASLNSPPESWALSSHRGSILTTIGLPIVAGILATLCLYLLARNHEQSQIQHAFRAAVAETALRLQELDSATNLRLRLEDLAQNVFADAADSDVTLTANGIPFAMISWRLEEHTDNSPDVVFWDAEQQTLLTGPNEDPFDRIEQFSEDLRKKVTWPDRSMTLTARMSSEFLSVHASSLPLWTLLIGGLLTLTVGGHAWQLRHREERHLAVVQNQTSELEETRARLELALRNANVGLWDWNAKTNEVFFSETTRTQLGYPADAPWGDFSDWEDRLHPSDHAAALERVQECLTKQSESYTSRFRLRCADGSYRWIQAQGRLDFDEDGRPRRMVGVHVDIHDRQLAEEQLQRERSELGLILDALPSMVFFKDDQNRILRVNRAVAEALGRPKSEIEGRRAVELYPDDAERFFEDDQAVMTSGQAKLAYVEPAGEIWLRTDKVPLPNADGQYDRILVVCTNVTEQRRAGELVRLAFQASPAGLMMVRADGRIAMANTMMARTFGYTDEELVGRDLSDLIPEAVRSRHADHFARFLKDPVSREMGDGADLLARHADGSTFPVEVGLTPVVTAEGPHVMASLVDMTERHANARRLERMQRLLEQTSRIARVGGWELDITTMTPLWSDEVCRIHDRPCGYQPNIDEAIDYYTEESLPIIQQAVERGIQEHQPWDLELQLRTAKDRIIWVRTMGVPEVVDGQCVRLWGTFQDISERHAAEQALRESQERQQLALAGGDLGAWDWNIETGQVTFDDRWAEMLGYRLDEIEPNVSTWEKLVHPDDMPKVMEVLTAHLEGRTNSYETEHRVQHKSGHWLWILDKGRVTERNADGTPRRACGTHLDITQRVQNQQKLSEYAEQLEAVNQELTEFAYVASHDLRAPLRGISHLVEWIDEDIAASGMELPPDAGKHLQNVRKQVSRMDGLLTGLLEYSRAGRRRYRVEEIATRDLVDHAIAMAGLPAGMKTEVTGEFPVILSERSPFERVLLNLIANAAKHHDQTDGKIQVSSSVSGPTLRIEITDDGPGIPEKFHERVFAIFQTLQPRDKVEGSGMGLSIVKKLVESYGGEVGIRAAQPRGCTFWFTWPCDADSIAASRLKAS